MRLINAMVTQITRLNALIIRYTFKQENAKILLNVGRGGGGGLL
jgi:hypothetical protein